MNMSGLISQNIAEIEKRIIAACQKSGRARSEVTLIAVSKTFPLNLIREAIESDLLVFGENYIPEGSQKAQTIKLETPQAKFHFIGHLQRNKVKSVVSDFELIQTVDRIELAQEIDKQAAKIGKVMPVLLQVNISEEESKFGCQRESLAPLAESVCKLANLSLQGIMSIGSALTLDMKEERSISIVTEEFKEMGILKSSLESKLGFILPELSMGMSGDFELAINHGATIVRIGTSIFGRR